MKKQISKKGIESKSNVILNVSYCALQTLLKTQTVSYYNKGAYGWNWDAYILKGVTIITGYRNFITNAINVNNAICEKYEKLAKEIIKNISDYETQKEELLILLDGFIDEVLNYDK